MTAPEMMWHGSSSHVIHVSRYPPAHDVPRHSSCICSASVLQDSALLRPLLTSVIKCERQQVAKVLNAFTGEVASTDPEAGILKLPQG